MKSRYMRKLLFAIALMISACASAQWVTKDTSWKLSDGREFWSRITYDPSGDSTEGILFMPGRGEANTSYIPGNLVLYGPHYWLANGWDGTVTLGNGIHRPILITLIQRTTSNSNWFPTFPEQIVLAIFNRFKIKRKAFHYFALSNGMQWGGTTAVYKASANDERFLKMFASVVDIQGEAPISPNLTYTLPHPQRWGNRAKTYGGAYLAFEQTVGTWNKADIIRSIEDSLGFGNKKGYLMYTNVSGGCHCAFNYFMDPSQTNWTPSHPNYVATKSGFASRTIEGGQNTFQWALRQGDTTLPGGNRPPTVTSVNNQTITLPTSSVSVSSTATDPEGASMTYSWTKISGSGTASAPTSTSTNITGLTQGVSEWEFRATDPAGLYGSSRFTITVNATAANQKPVVTITPVGAVTYPTNSVSVAASSSDPDGSIASHYFRPESGATYAIASPTSNTTTISNLPLGASVVYYVAYDNTGDSTRVSIPLQVNPASSGGSKSNTAIKVAISPNGSAKAVTDPSWNVWAPSSWAGSAIRTQPLNDQFGNATNITATLGVSSGISDNTSQAGYPGTISARPPELVNYASFSSQAAGRDLTIAGLEQSKKYNIVLHAIRYTNIATSNSYTLQGTTHTVRVDYGSASGANTAMKPDTFSTVTPDAGGNIVIRIGRPSSNNYLSGVEVIELASEAGNLIPVANAGTNITIKLPTNSVQLNGSQSYDPDAGTLSYAWSLVSGPNNPAITNPNTVNPTVPGLTEGDYFFRLTVTDPGGAQSSSDVFVKVLPAGNALPKTDAGPDSTINRNSYTLRGKLSDDDGTIDASFTLWNNYSGPTPVVIENNTALETRVTGMNAVGDYFFSLRGRDNDGAVVYDTVRIRVNIATTFDCKAEAGPNFVIDANTSNSFAVLDGSLSVGADSVEWKRLTDVDFPKWKARVLNPKSKKAYAMILPPKDGGYNYELTVYGPGGCISRDTMNVTRRRNKTRQGVDGTRGWHLVTAADTSVLRSMGVNNPVIGKDCYVPGANFENSEDGYTAIAIGSGLRLEPGAKIYIAEGDYAYITIKVDSGTCVGSPTDSIKIVPVGGQVSTRYMTIQNFVYWKLSGKYIPGQQGHPDYRGHDVGSWAYVEDKYGFNIDNRYTSLVSVGLKIDGYHTNHGEIEYVSVRNGGFANLQIKQDNRNNTFTGMTVSNCFFKGSHGEGYYGGSTLTSSIRHRLNSFVFKNNIFLHCGNEIFQGNNNNGGAVFSNNVFINSATNYMSPFNVDQSFGGQFTFNGGKNKITNNIFDGTGFQDLNYYQSYHDSASNATDTVFVINNYFRGGRGRYGGVINLSNNPPANLLGYWVGNYFSKYDFLGDRIYQPTNLLGANSNYLLQVIGSPGGIRVKIRDSYFDGSKSLFMVPNTAVDTANIQLREIPAPKYKNSGWPYGFDYKYLAEWAYLIYDTWGDESTSVTRTNIKRGDSVYYQLNDLVIHMGSYYRSKISENFGHMPQGKSDEYWEMLTWQYNGATYTYPPNDYRLADDDPYKALGMGLIDSVASTDPGGPVNPPPPNQAPTWVTRPETQAITYPANTVPVRAVATDDGVVTAYRIRLISGSNSYFSITGQGSGLWSIRFDDAAFPTSGQANFEFEVEAEDNSTATSTIRFIISLKARRPGIPVTKEPRQYTEVILPRKQ